MSILGLNTLDLLLIFILFIGGLVGMLRGIGPQLTSVASIWLALLAALWTYRLLSVNIFIESGYFNKVSADSLAFVVMFLFFFHAIRLVIRYLTKPPEERKKKPQRKGRVGPVEEAPPSLVQRFIIGPIMTLGGAILGVVLTALWTAIILGVLQFFFQVDISQAGAGQGLVNQMNSSTLVPQFNQILLYLVKSLDLFVFGDEVNILKKVVCTVFPDSCV
ncbi:MAG: hypothetical protein FOGNACKC_01903 [Anaerolineae bacterium]|nr:hypothetical protein [Anaerolineae bacterium]